MFRRWPSIINQHGFASEYHFCGHALGMLPAKMPVNFERQHSTVTMTKPAGDCWYINPAFNAARRKEVSQGMVGEPGAADNAAGPCQRFLAF